MSVTADTRAGLRDRAAAVLHGNDEGSWTKASPILYPHQWSWDSAFIAIGWAHLDVGRAMLELEQLFAAQWATGMVPHLVFRAATPDHPIILRDRGLTTDQMLAVRRLARLSSGVIT